MNSMNADAMIDTNVLVYAASVLEADQDKSRVSRSILQNERVGISVQVLQEFLVVTTRKVRRTWSLKDAIDWIEALEDFPCVPVDAPLVRFGGDLATRFRLSYWDGAILAAAHRLSASVLYTEDLNHGQLYGSVRAHNPFKPH